MDKQEPVDERVELRKEIEQLHLGMELAWGLIANAYGGEWDQASERSGWKKAAERWRDEVWNRIASECGEPEVEVPAP